MKACRIAATIRCMDDNGEMSSAMDGIGDRSRSRVSVSKGVARCRLVYKGGSSGVDGNKTPCNIPSPSNLTAQLSVLLPIATT